MKIRLREIDHVVLRVRDMQRMTRFYSEVLGAEFVAFRPEFNMTHLRAGSSMIDLVAADAGAGRNMDHSRSTRRRSSRTSRRTTSRSATSAPATAPRATASRSTLPIRRVTRSS
jgi:catechol 2,3-dioxygenase-like lactoylglutathione lyase family enzyme